jgi:hypothetical protein
MSREWPVEIWEIENINAGILYVKAIPYSKNVNSNHNEII